MRWYLQVAHGHFFVSVLPQNFNDHLYADRSQHMVKALVPHFELFCTGDVYICKGL